MLALAGLLAIAGGIIKYLSFKNRRQKQDIETLEHDAEVQDQIHEKDIERIRFEAANKVRVAQVNDETNLDKLDKKRGEIVNKNGFKKVKK